MSRTLLLLALALAGCGKSAEPSVPRIETIENEDVRCWRISSDSAWVMKGDWQCKSKGLKP